jgi:hypothetical protein
MFTNTKKVDTNPHRDMRVGYGSGVASRYSIH